MKKWLMLALLPYALLYRKLKGSQVALFWGAVGVFAIEQYASYLIEVEMVGRPFVHVVDYIFTTMIFVTYVTAAAIFAFMDALKDYFDAADR